MGQLIELENYRRHKTAPTPTWTVWSCGHCGGKLWTVCVDAQVRCALCSMRAANLKAGTIENQLFDQDLA
ncbi:MAG: hypothetical protein ACREUV_01865 [Burkholderiales bacterium]